MSKTGQHKIDSFQTAAKIVALSLFTYLFLIMENSPLADIVKCGLVFRYVIIPLPQWALITCLVLAWKYMSGEKWNKAIVKSVILGLALCLYLPMLDTVRQTWRDASLPGAYQFYINAYSFAVTSLLMVWGSDVLSSIHSGDVFFFPMSLTAIYAIVFYSMEGRLLEAGAFSFIFAVSGMFDKARRKIIPGQVRSVMEKIFSDNRILLMLIFLVAMAACLVFLRHLLMVEGQNYPLASDDGDTYDLYGWRGVSDPMIYVRESPHYFYIFYSVFLTAIYKVFGHSYAAAGIAQAVIWAVLCCMVFIFTLGVTGKKGIALLASLGVALDSTLIHVAATLNTEVLYIPLVFSVFLFLFFYKENRNGGLSIALLLLSGILLGVSSIVRPMAAGLCVFILPWVLFYGRDYKNNNIVKRTRDAALFFVLMLLPVLPIIYINYQNTNEFFFVYNNKYMPGTRIPTNFGEWKVKSTWGEKLVPSNKKLIELGMVNPSSDPAGCIRAVIKRPAEFARAFTEIVPARTRNLFLWPSFGSFDAVYMLNPSRQMNRYAPSLEFYTIALFCAGFYFFITSKIKTGVKILSVLVIIYYWIFHGVFFLLQSSRYASPMRPFLYIMFACGVYCTFIKFRSILRNDKGLI